MEGSQNSNPCLEHCGLTSHLPGTHDLKFFDYLDRALILKKKQRFNKKFLQPNFHLAISYDYEKEEFSWDDSGSIVQPLLWQSKGDRTWPILETLVMAYKVVLVHFKTLCHFLSTIEIMLEL